MTGNEKEQEKDQEFWFKPKRHGYGATPTHWKGWVATLAFSVALAVVSLGVLLSLTDENRLAGMLAWAVGLLIAVLVFTHFTKSKTDGPWGWRWNGKLYRDMLKNNEHVDKD
ncbi:MAG: hypothetical protein ACRBCJ_07335 [Hyphomicrobiaceae bacterium]